MDPRINLFENYDLNEVSKLIYKRKVKERTRIINKFINKAKSRRYENIPMSYDKLIVQNTNNYRYFLYMTAVASNFILYNLFFVGIYNNFLFQNLYFNPKVIPFFVKLGVTSVLSYYIYKIKWERFIYSPDLYRIAMNSNINSKESTK